MADLATGATYAFTLNAKKDGVVWDLSAATVKFYLHDPFGNRTGPYTATVTNPTGGVAVYTSLVADIGVAGSWSRSWEVTDGAVIGHWPPVAFTVQQAP
jgi:hypothetical protein